MEKDKEKVPETNLKSKLTFTVKQGEEEKKIVIDK